MNAIRLATPDDLAIVRRISLDAYSVYEPVLGNLPMPATEDYAPRIAAGEVWLLEDAREVLGLIVFERESDHLMIFSIAVAPSRRATATRPRCCASPKSRRAHGSLAKSASTRMR